MSVFFASGQVIQHETSAVNIEVPVRVYKGETFIDDLAIDDFEIYEDGIPQDIEAVYLIRRKAVERKEESVPVSAPEVKRHFVLYFQIYDILPEIDGAVQYFFEKVILPEDTLTVVTPIKSYRFKPEALERLSGDTIQNQLRNLLRRDVSAGNTEYRSLVEELERIIMTEGLEGIRETMCMTVLRKMLTADNVDDPLLYQLADNLKREAGQKHVFLFYQKRLVPVPKFLSWNNRLEVLHKDVSFDVKKVKKIFSDSSVVCHFMFVSHTPDYGMDVTRGVALESLELEMEERVSDVFSAFNELAEATGGLTAGSAKMDAALKKVAEASQNYYLLYYTPKNYKTDGKFHHIEVRVKRGGCKVLHRAGYVAD